MAPMAVAVQGAMGSPECRQALSAALAAREHHRRPRYCNIATNTTNFALLLLRSSSDGPRVILNTYWRFHGDNKNTNMGELKTSDYCMEMRQVKILKCSV